MVNFKLIANIFLLVFLISASYLILTERIQVLYIPKLEPANYSSNCSGLDLQRTTYCLRKELFKWYNYNITNIGKEMTIEELKAEGGVCSHYAKWYADNFESLGFETKEVSIKLNDTDWHRIAIASSPDGYCLLDQIAVDCIEMGFGEE